MACSKSASIFARMGRAANLLQMNTQNRTHSFGITKHPSVIPNCVPSIENIVNVRPLHSLTNIKLAAPLNQMTRGFHNTSPLQENDKPAEKQPTFGEQMSLRLINENGFLSWTRNSYLSAAVGATMLNGANVDVVQHAGILVLVVSAMNMTWGSGCHFSNLIRIRNRCAMSRPTLFLNLLGCLVHALLWLFILGYYIHFSGYTGWITNRRRQRQELAGSMPSKEQ